MLADYVYCTLTKPNMGQTIFCMGHSLVAFSRRKDNIEAVELPFNCDALYSLSYPPDTSVQAK